MGRKRREQGAETAPPQVAMERQQQTCWCGVSRSVLSDSATPWTVARQAPLSGDFSSKNTGVDCHFLLQGIFLTQGSNPGLSHCGQILHRLSHQGSPNRLESPGKYEDTGIWGRRRGCRVLGPPSRAPNNRVSGSLQAGAAELLKPSQSVKHTAALDLGQLEGDRPFINITAQQSPRSPHCTGHRVRTGVAYSVCVSEREEGSEELLIKMPSTFISFAQA